MTRTEWKKQIVKACKAAGTYQAYFGGAIDALSGILERRDEAQAQFEAEGGDMVIGEWRQSPLVKLVNEMNRDALAYWRDLGLTPVGLKRINEAAMKEKEKASPLQEALAKLAGG